MSDDQEGAEGSEPDTDTLLDATTALIPPLLSAMDALAYVGRHLHPPALMELVPGIEQFRGPVAEGLGTPDHVRGRPARPAGHRVVRRP